MHKKYLQITKELNVYNYSKNTKNQTNEKYAWDDTKRAEVALFSLWPPFKKENIRNRAKILKYQKTKSDLLTVDR